MRRGWTGLRAATWVAVTSPCRIERGPCTGLVNVLGTALASVLGADRPTRSALLIVIVIVMGICEEGKIRL